MLLENVEKYAAYVGNAIVNENIDTETLTANTLAIILPRANIGDYNN